MKNIFYICVLAALIFSACNGKNLGDQRTDLSENRIPDTVRLDTVKNRDMLIILSIMPDSLTRIFNWSRNQRTDLRRELGSQHYFLDSAHHFANLKKIENDYLEFHTGDNTFTMRTYQIRDGHYVILAIDQIGDKQKLTAYELYKHSAEVMDLNIILGKYNYLFLKDESNQSCLGMFYEKNPVFNFDISDPAMVVVKLTNYSKSDSKDCLLGNEMVLKFNPVRHPFDVVEFNWSE